MQTEYPRKIIFDMDGVITSEECYWNAAALVVWELLFSERGFALQAPPSLPPFEPSPDPALVARVRRVIFQDDQVITFFKRRAVNSNWDLAFYTFIFQMTLYLLHGSAQLPHGKLHQDFGGEDFGVEDLPRLGSMLASTPPSFSLSFERILENWAGEATGADLGPRIRALIPEHCPAAALAPSLFTTGSRLWGGVRRVFQEWYFGEALYKNFVGQDAGIAGKRGLITEEEPLLPVAELRAMLEKLCRDGWTLGIATGRPHNELITPLAQMGLLDLFDKESVVTFDVVEETQQSLPATEETLSLGKPHPFSLLKAYWGSSYHSLSLVSPPYPSPPAELCYFVGDAPADLLAARAADVSFIAVLTGLAGVGGRDFFRKEGAHHILPDVTYLPSLLAKA